MRFFSIALLLACAGRSAKDADVLVNDPEAYFPLQLGNTWAYDVGDAAGPPEERMLIINRVTQRQGALAVVSSGGKDTQYFVATDGIRRGEQYVYRWPVRVGDAWVLPDGGAKVVSVSAQVKTSAGTYEGCLAVEETRSDRKVTTVFARGVGPVRVEIHASDGSKLLGTLRSFGPATDDRDK